MDLRLLSLEQLIGLYADVSADIKAYEALGLDVPKDSSKQLAAIERQVKELKRAETEKQLETLQLRRKALATADEKRAALDADIEALKAKLA